MKTTLLAGLAALALLATGAAANPVNNGNLGGDATQGQAQGQLQGQAQGQTATGGAGGQGGAGGAGGVASAVTGASSSVASSGGNQQSTVVGAQKRDPVNTAWAAPASVGDCGRSIGLGGQVIGFGASFSIPLAAKDRERRCNAALLDQLGEREAAVQLLSHDPEVNAAVTLVRTRKGAQ